MTEKIMFLCPHNAAKSVIAAADFNRLAAELGLDARADSAGTEPSETVSPVAARLLAGEGVDVSGHVPRHVTADDLNSADRIIAFGCAPETLGVPPEQVEQWADVPAVSEQPEAARAAIAAHVERLVAELRERA
jgi:arsenate reductase